MADFDICYPFLLSNEDYDPPRFEAVPDPTKSNPDAKAISGINSADWPDAFARIAALPSIDRPPAVKAFYLENFWNEWLSRVESNRVAAMILDSSVNEGAGVAVKLAQIAAGLPQAQQDGEWGPITLGAINALAAGSWVPAFITARESRYQEIGGPDLPEWLNRAKKVPQFS